MPGRPLSPAAPPPSVGGSRSSESLSSSWIWSSGPASVMYLPQGTGGGTGGVSWECWQPRKHTSAHCSRVRGAGSTPTAAAAGSKAGLHGDEDSQCRAATLPALPSLGVELVQHAIQRLVVGDLEAAQHDPLSHIVQAHIPAAGGECGRSRGAGGQLSTEKCRPGRAWDANLGSLACSNLMCNTASRALQRMATCWLCALMCTAAALTCCCRPPAGRSRLRSRPGW